MDISERVKTIMLDVTARSHSTVLDAMAGSLLPSAGRDNYRAVCDLKGHESLEGTDCAVFHCLSEAVNDITIGLAISKKGIPQKGKKHYVKIFFLIISPIRESGAHLQLLSRLEWLLTDKSFSQALVSARDEGAVRKEIKRAEGSHRSLYIPLSRDEVFSELGTNGRGLGEEEATKRLGLVGPNRIKTIVKGVLLKDFLSNLFLNLFAVLLWAGGAMAFIGGMPQLGWAIFLVIIINALFSFWQEYKAERAVDALLVLLPKNVRVIRGGRERAINSETLVPGDIIRLSEGEKVPADGRLVMADEMRVDNSALTGENKPVYKVSEPLMDGAAFIWTEVPNLVFAGTTVVSGSGEMVVTSTGMDTEIGRVAYLTQAIKTEESPLQKELRNVTKIVTMIAVGLGLAFFFMGFGLAGLTFAESFIFAIGIIVANVPEGLLPTVSLSLAMGIQRMAKRNAIVKKLSSVETLGCATVICTDKTGTLTENRMRVTSIFANAALVEVTGAGYAPVGDFLLNNAPLSEKDLDGLGVRLALKATALCNNATLTRPAGAEAEWGVSGDPTEGAMLAAAVKAGVKLDELHGLFPRTAHLPFERLRKMMTTVHEVKPTAEDPLLKKIIKDSTHAAFVKGAPKELISLCTTILEDNGLKDLTEEEKAGILAQNDLMAARGLRILGVAGRGVEKKASYAATDIEKGLCFLGLVAMLDPPRPEVKEALRDCREAGIKVIMITGDYGLTAKAIARETGLAPDARVITGVELNAMGRNELKDALKSDGVIFARVAPEDKLNIVSALQENNEVVAVTGDGVNDAPALKKADIGVAMGLRGSDVAKEAADIVLADDNFASIVDAIREGRAIYANIKKFVTYIFASNIPEIIPFIGFVIFKIPLPLTVMQILAVDLGTDVFPALGLGVEPPEKGIMKEPPRPRTKRLLDFKTLARAYMFLGPIEAVLAMAAFFFAYYIRGWEPGTALPAGGPSYLAATTMTFAAIVACQIGNVFACRTERESVFTVGFLKNRLVLSSIAIEAAIMLVLIYVPMLQRTFGFAPIGFKDWAFLLMFPPTLILADEARKALNRLKKF